ncbi:MAG: GNAT family N-acetyltransferase [archaeon]
MAETKIVKMKSNYAKKLRDIWIKQGVIEYTLQTKKLTVKDTLKKLINNQGKTFVAIINNIPVGCVAIRFFNGRRNHTAEIVIFVDPTQQSTGIGTKLIKTALKTIKEKKLKRLELEVNADNKKAIGLYKKFGFKIEGKKRKAVQRGTKLVDNYIMARIFN